MTKKKRFCRVPDSGLVPIDFPADFEGKAERAVRQLGKYQAVCFWCAYGYDEYTRKAEDEHFAYDCPEAPQELREDAMKRMLLGGNDTEEGQGDDAETK